MWCDGEESCEASPGRWRMEIEIIKLKRKDVPHFPDPFMLLNLYFIYSLIINNLFFLLWISLYRSAPDISRRKRRNKDKGWLSCDWSQQSPKNWTKRLIYGRERNSITHTEVVSFMPSSILVVLQNLLLWIIIDSKRNQTRIVSLFSSLAYFIWWIWSEERWSESWRELSIYRLQMHSQGLPRRNGWTNIVLGQQKRDKRAKPKGILRG